MALSAMNPVSSMTNTGCAGGYPPLLALLLGKERCARDRMTGRTVAKDERAQTDIFETKR